VLPCLSSRAGSDSADASSKGNGNEQAKLFEHKLAVLERQLAESEAAKQAAEMRYTERISRSVGNSDAQLQVTHT